MNNPPRVGILAASLFVRVAVEAAVRGCGAVPVILGSLADARVAGSSVIILDLETPGLRVAEGIAELVRVGVHVLAFSSREDDAVLGVARKAGAVALPRVGFLRQLPALLGFFVDDSEVE